MVSSNPASRTHWVILDMLLDLLSYFSAHKLGAGGTPLLRRPTGCRENPRHQPCSRGHASGRPSHLLLPFKKSPSSGRIPRPAPKTSACSATDSPPSPGSQWGEPHPLLSPALSLVAVLPSPAQRGKLYSCPPPPLCGGRRSMVKGSPIPRVSRDPTSHAVMLNCQIGEEKQMTFILLSPAPPIPVLSILSGNQTPWVPSQDQFGRSTWRVRN